MSNQQLYNQHRANGVPHEEAITALGVNAATARTLKSRYTKGATAEARPRKVAKKQASIFEAAHIAPVGTTLTKQTPDGWVSVTRESETGALAMDSEVLQKFVALGEKTAQAPNLPHVERKSQSGINYRRVILYALLIAPTLASTQNAYHVSAQIMGDVFGSACLTVVLSVTALGFVAVGVRNWYTVPLALLLIGYESFCNLTRIYAGLMIGGKWGTSEFLGRVCDVFNSGSHYTAITLGGITALLLAATQYVSIFELNKKP